MRQAHRLLRSNPGVNSQNTTGLAEQMTAGIEELHEGIAEASDKGKPTLRRILETHEAVLDGVRRAQEAA